MADWRAPLAVAAVGAVALLTGAAPARAGLLVDPRAYGHGAQQTPQQQQPAPPADPGYAVAAYPLRWCVQGATVTMVFSAVLSAPAVVTGIGAPLGAAEIATAAGTGCLFGVAWGATLTSVQWVGSQVLWLFSVDPPPPRIMAVQART